MSVYVGEIDIFPFNFVPRGWLACDGTERSVSQQLGDETLYDLIHPRLGTGGGRYRLPDYSALLPPDLRYCVAIHGIYPDASYAGHRKRCIGEVGTFYLRSDFAPGAWQRCAAGSAPAIPQADCLSAKTGDPTLPLNEALAGSIRLIDVRVAGTEHLAWFPCDGRKIKRGSEESMILLSLIGTTFGGHANEFNLPKIPAPHGHAYYINAYGTYPERP